jgi:cytochrome bd-type quinol oxidase subunit 2
VWTVALGVVWLVVPVASSGSTTVLSDGTQVVESSRETLVDGEGMSVVAVLAVPVLIAGLAVLASRWRHARQARFVAGGVLFAACLLGAASIGLPYVPAAVGLLVAGSATPREPQSACP